MCCCRKDRRWLCPTAQDTLSRRSQTEHGKPRVTPGTHAPFGPRRPRPGGEAWQWRRRALLLGWFDCLFAGGDGRGVRCRRYRIRNSHNERRPLFRQQPMMESSSNAWAAVRVAKTQSGQVLDQGTRQANRPCLCCCFGNEFEPFFPSIFVKDRTRAGILVPPCVCKLDASLKLERSKARTSHPASPPES